MRGRDKVICVCLGIFFTLLLLEVFLRLLGFGYNLYYHPPVARNSGFRIFCIGESTTWGIGATDPIEKGYPHQLEMMLNKRFKGKDVQCLFERTIGQNTSEILIKLPQYIKKYQPQMVILMVGANNSWNMDSSNILLFGKTPFNWLCLKTMVVLDSFRVWKLLKNTVFSLGFYRERWNYYFPSDGFERLKRQEAVMDCRIFDELAAHDMEEMIRILQSNGIKVLMSTYPVEARGLFDIKQRLSDKYGLPFVDNFSAFQRLSPVGDYLWTDKWHPNDQGYVVLAGNIFKAILINRMIE